MHRTQNKKKNPCFHSGGVRLESGQEHRILLHFLGLLRPLQMNSSKGRMQVLWGLKPIQVLGPFKEKEYKITSTKLGKKVNIF